MLRALEDLEPVGLDLRKPVAESDTDSSGEFCSAASSAFTSELSSQKDLPED